MERRPGTPSLLRELNDRAALELLLTGGPLTRAQLGAHTGLSKVTASQLLSRLEDRGLVTVAGELAGGRGPNAALYAVVPSTAYVAGLHVDLDEVSAGVADVTGNVVAEVSVNPSSAQDPVELVRGAVVTACASAGVSPESLRAFVIGTPGVMDPRTGDPKLTINLPDWHEGVLEALRSELGRPVTLENDVNLAAMAERAVGAAVGVPDFVLVWIGIGLGLATVLGGRLHRGVGGAAGEIGYLPVPGVPLPQDVTHPATGAFQSLVGAQAVLPPSPRPSSRPSRVTSAAASSSPTWPAVSQPASPPSPSSSTRALSSSAVTSAGPAATRWPTGWPRRSAGSARPARRSSPPGSRAARSCAARSSRPSSRPAGTCSTRSRALSGDRPDVSQADSGRTTSHRHGGRPGAVISTARPRTGPPRCLRSSAQPAPRGDCQSRGP
jgi:DNA-binding transcriptional ArsR family regulator